MASLTESSLIYSPNNSNNSNSNKNNWYDRVYLCVEHKGNTQVIGNFHCYPFESYEKADEYSKNISYIYQDNKIRHTMVPMCKWIPNRFHSYFINKTLKNMYWKSNIKMM
jgi:hypothetical protein